MVKIWWQLASLMKSQHVPLALFVATAHNLLEENLPIVLFSLSYALLVRERETEVGPQLKIAIRTAETSNF